MDGRELNSLVGRMFKVNAKNQNSANKLTCAEYPDFVTQILSNDICYIDMNNSEPESNNINNNNNCSRSFKRMLLDNSLDPRFYSKQIASLALA